MNRIINIALCFYVAISATAMNSSDSAERIDGSDSSVKELSFNDTEYEWNQYESKESVAVLKPEGLLLENKTDENVAYSVSEFPVDIENPAFTFEVKLQDFKADEKSVGLIFDYENNRNYKGFVVNKKSFVYFSVQKGEMSIIKQTLVKPGKKINSISMKIRFGKMEAYVNGLEVTKIKNIKIDNQMLGVIFQGKGRALFKSFVFDMPDSSDESESATTDS